MNGWTTTRVWGINSKMVVAATIEEAIAAFRLFAPDDDVTTVKAITLSGSDYDAIIKETEK